MTDDRAGDPAASGDGARSGAVADEEVGRNVPVRSILVATDFSEAADAAVGRAFELAARWGAAVRVVHVAAAGLSAELTEVANQYLEQLALDAPVSVVTALITGRPGAEIVLEAERRQSDVVVVGAHGAHWLRDIFLGSTAETVADTSPVPVLVVKSSDSSRYSTVLLAVDSSSRSFRAAQFGLELTPAARHVLAHAVTVLGENLLRLNGASDHAIDELRRGQLAAVRPDIERLVRELTPTPAEVLVEPGRPEEMVSTLAARRDAGLVVVGVERGAGLRHALVGSVSRHAMQRAPCDVLVVPLQ